MARHSSNRDRIERLAQEAEITRREKEAAAAKKQIAPAARTTKARQAAAAPVGRTKVVWLVCDHTGKAVQTFPNREEDAARAEASRRTDETGKTHFIKRGEAPFE